MGKSLVVVESPSKAKTLTKYLGTKYIVRASVGHVRDLPKSRFGIRIDKDFKPEYTVIRGKKKILDELKKLAGKADRVYLGPDPDREGEAIAWHIAEELKLKKKQIYRVLFNEITRKAVERAMEHPGPIDQHKVDAQQARRILDRIVGYTISPLLWEKVRRGLSAGRVQSVAVRLVCEREQEIQAFRSREYWSITARLQAAQPPPFEAKLIRLGGKAAEIPDAGTAESTRARLVDRAYVVRRVEKRERNRQPSPPFTTSKLQQDAVHKLRFTAKKTMTLAQHLYEGVEIGEEGPVGLLTYMRTDSTRVAEEAQREAAAFIAARFGQQSLPERPPVYRSRKGAQDAHEAIRPTSVERHPDTLQRVLPRDLYLLYRLIWSRFVASQMTAAVYDVTKVDLEAGDALFRATGTVLKTPGFTAVYTEEREETTTQPPAQDTGEKEEELEVDEAAGQLPSLQEGETVRLLGLVPKQHFTQPPPRYNEALLIKDLEEKGIGRPSTYHTILSTIQDRKYVEKKERRLYPTDLGKVVNELLVEHFPEVLNVQFTARMEDELDEIEEGQRPWVQTVREFYQPFEQRVKKAQIEMRDVKREEVPTDIVCELCGNKMVIRWGRNGRFLACPGYPECRNTKEFVEGPGGEIRVVAREQSTEQKCDRCGSPMVIKTGRFGRFVACSAYPQCKNTKPLSVGVHCPRPGCPGSLAEKRTRRGKLFFACTEYPKCDFALWDRPVPRPCPRCKAPFLVEKLDRNRGTRVLCREEGCGYEESVTSA